MTLPNRITVARLALIPVIAATIALYRPGEEWIRYAALALYAIAAGSDGIDGYIARHYNQSSKLGTALDPLADKLLVNITFILLAVNDSFEVFVPKWLPPILVARDIIITGGAYAIRQKMGAVRIKPRILGKATMLAQSLAIIAVLLLWPHANWVIGTMLLLVALSCADYIAQGIAQIRRPVEQSHG